MTLLVNEYTSPNRFNLKMDYPLPKKLHAIPADLLDLRPESEIEHDLLNPKSVADEKNIWFFWDSGFNRMHPYAKRNIRAWYRRFSRQGWTIRVVDGLPASPSTSQTTSTL